MKKFSIILVFSIFVLFLSGCQLAVTEDLTSGLITDDQSDEYLGYIPVRFNYSIYNNETSQMEDISEYIYYTWLFSDSLQDEYLVTGIEAGSSMEILFSSTNTHITENDEGIQSRKITEIMEANVYISKSLESTPLYPTITYMNYNDEEMISKDYGVAMQEGLSITSSYESSFPNGKVFNLELTMNFMFLDDLQSIEIREYSADDQLITSTTITETTLLEELNLNENTEYIFVVETYEDQSGNLYTERLYYYDESTLYYQYKFFNEEGFLYLGYLKLYFPE